ncbi:MAG TPA: hypothetical protein VGY66_06020 [Gemmataceae bacterium]|jgi:hypothetical protein|nr:hypothetical protein [Gemmataceae bacterium]
MMQRASFVQVILFPSAGSLMPPDRQLHVNLDLGHYHRREPEPANLAPCGEALGLDCDLVAAVLQRRDLGLSH